MTDPMGRLTAALADRYRIERELGAGGMATVYLAADLKHDRKVAIKVLKPELAAVLGAERFVQEIKTTAALSHPHILPLFDSGSADGQLYYVMPYIEGETIRDKLNRETQFGIPEAVKITTEVADALDYAHRHGVIHRDIKPENILLHDGRPMVMDFGIALAVSAAAGGRMTETGLSLGTPHYMSPEQATADKEITGRSDIYSLGSVLYEMLTGEPPHLGTSAQQIIMKIVTEDAQPVTRLRKSVPPNIAAAVARSLEKLPADRFTTAREFGEALVDPGFTTVSTAVAMTATPWRRPALLLGALAVTSLLAIVGWLRKTGGSAGSDGPLAYQVHLTPSESDLAFVASQLSVSADGSVIVYSDTVGGQRQLWVKERGVAEPRPIPGTTGGETPFISPDGRSVAYRVDTQLLRISIAGGAPRLLSDSARLDGQSVRGAWLDNGTIVFLGDLSRFLFAVSDTGGATRRIATTDQLLGFPVNVTPVPGHDAVIVTVCDIGSCTNQIVNLVQVGSGEIQRILPGSAGAWALKGNRLLNILPDGTLFMASFDPATGKVGEGTQLATGIAVAGRGPELSVGVDGVIVEGVGGEESFTNRTQLVLAGMDGTTRVVDSAWSTVFANNSRLDLSPDGHRLLFSQIEPDGVESALEVKPYPNGSATQFSSIGTQSVRAAWSADGRRIAWVVVDSAGKASARQQAADGSGRPALLAEEPRGVFEINFSPDGAWLLYRTDDVAAGSGDIYARRTSGDTTTIAVATSEAEETSAAISPDGHWVAYAARLGAAKEIIVRPFPNVDAGRVQVTNGGGAEPLWSADGRTLYYRNAGLGQILAAKMEPDGTFPRDGRSVVFQYPPREYWDNDDTRQYSITPDGKGFLLMRRIRSAAGSTPMRLILREHIIPGAH